MDTFSSSLLPVSFYVSSKIVLSMDKLNGRLDTGLGKVFREAFSYADSKDISV